jgi:hypothetical protein
MLRVILLAAEHVKYLASPPQFFRHALKGQMRIKRKVRAPYPNLSGQSAAHIY